MTQKPDKTNYETNDKSLESVVKDSYMIYHERRPDEDVTQAVAEERFQALVRRVEQLQQQYGAEVFSYRRFEYVKAIAAVIKEPEILELLRKEGYAVKDQGRMTTL